MAFVRLLKSTSTQKKSEFYFLSLAALWSIFAWVALKTLKSCKKLKAKQNPLISEVAELIGILVSNFPGPQFGQLYYRSLEHDKMNALICSKGNYNAHMKLSFQSMIELDWWISNMPFACKNIHPSKQRFSYKKMLQTMGGGQCMVTNK